MSRAERPTRENSNTRKVREFTTESMLRNARTILTQHIDADTAEDILLTSVIIKKNHSGRFPKGAISYVASTVASFGGEMGWDMNSPEMGYLSAFHILHGLDKRKAILKENREMFERGERRFMTPEKQRETLAAEEKELIKLQEYSEKTARALADYATVNLPQDGRYLAIIRSLGYFTNEAMKDGGIGRKHFMTVLKEGKIDEAYEILENTAIFKEVNGLV